MKAARRRLLPALLIGQAACALAALLHVTGAAGVPDLIAYDRGLRLRAAAGRSDDRIVLVTIAEQDLAAHGWPLGDDHLAQLLDRLSAARPRAIGVDIYRDRPVPPGTEQLHDLLATRPDILWVYRFATADGRMIPAPAILRDTDRIGFADMITDDDGVVRRGLLYLSDAEGRTGTGFALALALRYLAPLGIVPRPDPDNPGHLRLGGTTIRPLEPTDGAYAGIDARGYQFLLDYAPGPAPFAVWSVHDVLAGTVPATALADRLVLVAVTADSVKDFFRTPLGAGDAPGGFSYGVTLHAQTAGQLLRMALDGVPAMRGIGSAGEILVIWLAGTVGGLAGLVLRGAGRFGAAALAGTGGLAALWYLALTGYWWLPLAGPVLAWLAAIGLVTAYVSLSERAERTLLMSLFESHLSEPVAEALWRERDTFMKGGRPKPQRLTATVLFSDIAGFTPISERLDPEQLTAWLDIYMEAMVRVVLDHDGIVLRFVGDAILAVFGVPIPRTTEAETDRDAANAVRCALAMGTALGELNQRWDLDGLPPVSIRIGIHTGVMVAGSMGAAQHLEYSLVGDSVNTAARLEALPKTLTGLTGDPRCRIIVGEATWQRLGGRFAGRRVGIVPLKGKEDTIAVYEILGTHTKAGENDIHDIEERKTGGTPCERDPHHLG